MRYGIAIVLLLTSSYKARNVNFVNVRNIFFIFKRYARTQMFTPERGDRPGVPNYLVVLTDGKSNNPEQTWLEAREAREQGIITTIGIGGGKTKIPS